jgi:hypothetical protein
LVPPSSESQLPANGAASAVADKKQNPMVADVRNFISSFHFTDFTRHETQFERGQTMAASFAG